MHSSTKLKQKHEARNVLVLQPRSTCAQLEKSGGHACERREFSRSKFRAPPLFSGPVVLYLVPVSINRLFQVTVVQSHL